MKNFAFENAPDLQSALNILHQEQKKAFVVAGGTNVLVDIRAGKHNNLKLVSIRDIAELRGIREVGDKISVGPLTTLSDLANSKLLSEKAPALFLAANSFADPTTRNSATIGGNIADASPSADTAPALLALEAEVVIAKKGGERRVPICDFFLGVRHTVLEADELITAIEFAPNAQSAFYKIGLRNAMAISVVTAAAAVKLEGGVVKSCAIALGAVAPKPVRAYNVEKALVGKKYDEAAVQEALKALSQDISPIDDIRSTAEYRGGVAPVIVKRVLDKACGVCAKEGGK